MNEELELIDKSIDEMTQAHPVESQAGTKKCQICDSLLPASALYCGVCGALWCESDANVDTREIRILDPKDFSSAARSKRITAPLTLPSFAII